MEIIDLKMRVSLSDLLEKIVLLHNRLFDTNKFTLDEITKIDKQTIDSKIVSTAVGMLDELDLASYLDGFDGNIPFYYVLEQYRNINPSLMEDIESKREFVLKEGLNYKTLDYRIVTAALGDLLFEASKKQDEDYDFRLVKESSFSYDSAKGIINARFLLTESTI